MRTRMIFALAMLVMLPGQACDPTNPVGDDATPQEGYRKITLTGTIHTKNNEASATQEVGDGLTVFEYTGDFTMELWFPMEGGSVVQQRNTISLNEGGYVAVYYGNATRCDYTPASNAYDPVSFELEATLTLNSIFENDIPTDELRIRVKALPQQTITVTAACPYGVPGDYLDPAVYSSLLMYYYIDHIVIPIRVGDNQTNSWDDYPINPLFFVDITQTETCDIVPDLE